MNTFKCASARVAWSTREPVILNTFKIGARGGIAAGRRGWANAGPVLAGERRAQAYGISGVPFFVPDERYGVSGAQPAATYTAALAEAWSTRPVGAP